MNHRPSARALVAGVIVACIAATTGCQADKAAEEHLAVIPRSLFVEGSGVADAATARAVSRSAHALDMIGISGVSLTSEGQGVAASSETALGLLNQAHKEGTKAELLVDNVDPGSGGYSGEIASKMLGAEENRQFVIAGLTGEVEHGGYDGVQLDFEDLDADDAAGLVAFVTELRHTLPAKATVSMALRPQGSAEGYAQAGYDLVRLSRQADRFVLLAYDEHSSTSGGAGPVGGLPWATQALQALTRVVSPSKVDLGVAGYGYSWKADGTGSLVTPAEARSRAGDRARWVASQGEWTAKLADGTVLWWSDAQSLTVRANVAASQKLHGVVLWQVTTGDRISRAD